MNLTDFLQILVLFGVIVGLYFNYKQLQITNDQLKTSNEQLKAGNRQKTAEFIVSLNNSFIQNLEMSRIYYEIEYGRFIYDSSFHGSGKEIPLDNLLEHFESIAKLYQLSNFTIEDLEYLAYNYLVVYQDKSIQNYLAVLDTWYADRGMKLVPYSDFREVGVIIEKEYYDKSKDKRSESII